VAGFDLTPPFLFATITPIERRNIVSLKYFSDGGAIRKIIEINIKIPLNPPLRKGDKNRFSPLAKGS